MFRYTKTGIAKMNTIALLTMWGKKKKKHQKTF